MTYMWHINIGYQNNCNIVTNNNTYMVWSTNETMYINHNFIPLNEIDIDVRSHVTLVICDYIYIIIGVLVTNVVCD
jgi:hypothetical protein